MRKIAIFVEGLTEQIFIRTFIPLILGWENVSFECFQIYSEQMSAVPFLYPNEHAEVHFLIVDVSNDEKVLSAVKDREEWLIQKGYERIIALRDMYSKAYRDRAGRKIIDSVTKEFIAAHQTIIQQMSDPNKIKIYYGIMECEAWFLGMWNIFERIDPILTVAHIEEELGFNLSVIDPQTEFFKPADIVDSIMQLINQRYGKSRSEIEAICSKIKPQDVDNAFEHGRCASFRDFHGEIAN